MSEDSRHDPSSVRRLSLQHLDTLHRILQEQQRSIEILIDMRQHPEKYTDPPEKYLDWIKSGNGSATWNLDQLDKYMRDLISLTNDLIENQEIADDAYDQGYIDRFR